MDSNSVERFLSKNFGKLKVNDFSADFLSNNSLLSSCVNITSETGITITTSELLSGNIIRSAQSTTGSIDRLPNATDLLNRINIVTNTQASVGMSFNFNYVLQGDYPVALSQGTNSTLAGTSSITHGTFKTFSVVLTDISSGSYIIQAQGSGAGGNANTGDVTFDGVKIIGAGAASGDGNGYSTLELVPDINLYGNNQYLIIDPTAPSHIHIRAGGQQDNSSAELILGGERNNFRVLDNSSVIMQHEQRTDTFYYYADTTGFSSGSWFQENSLYYVQYTAVDQALNDKAFDFANDQENLLYVYYLDANNDTISVILTYGGSVSSLGNGVYKVRVNEAPPSSPTTLTALEYQIFTTNSNYAALENSTFQVSVYNDIRMYANNQFIMFNNSSTESIRLITDYDINSYTWDFGVNGHLTFPDTTVQTTAWAGGKVLNEPTSSIGTATDKQGDIAFSSGYFYYCTANYDGMSNIWKRVAWSNDTWGGA